MNDATLRHKFWGAGEPDCPRELKAGNGELHTLRCKTCGLDDPSNDVCGFDSIKRDAERYRELTVGSFGGEHDEFLIFWNDPEDGDSYPVSKEDLDAILDKRLSVVVTVTPDSLAKMQDTLVGATSPTCPQRTSEEP